MENLTCSALYNEEQCNAFLIARVVSSTLSIIGSLFLIFVIWLFRKYKRLLYRILLYIAICSLLHCITLIVADGNKSSDSIWCTVRGMSTQFNAWALTMWQVCITVHLYLSTMNIQADKWLERVYNIMCWGVSIIASIIPLIFGKYGPAITWCWISDHQWRVWAFYIEYVALTILMFALYAKVVHTVLTLKPRWRERPTESNKYEVYKKRIRPMMLYPLVILVVSVCPIAYRVHTFFHPDSETSFVLALLHVISVPMWGLLFAVIYGIDPETRQELSMLNIKATIRHRLYGGRIEEITVREQHTRKTNTNNTSKGTTTEREESSLSNISIEPSTVYPRA